MLGSAELTSSTFRQCPISRGGRRHRLPLWAWIAIIISIALIVLAIVVGVLGFLRKSKKPKKPLPEPRQAEKCKDKLFIIYNSSRFFSCSRSDKT